MSAVTVDVLTHTAHEAGLEGGTLQPLVNGACSFYPYPYPYPYSYLRLRLRLTLTPTPTPTPNPYPYP